jgi:solute carrier family 15 oligopeptide transporter 1
MLILIPLFDYAIYPALSRIHLLKGLLSRMTCGMVLTTVAFVFAALIEIRIEHSYLTTNVHSRVEFVNLASCRLSMQTDNSTVTVNQFETLQMELVNATVGCANASYLIHLDVNQNTRSVKNYYVFYETAENNLEFVNIKSSLVSQPVGASEARIYTATNEIGDSSITLKGKDVTYTFITKPMVNCSVLDYMEVDSHPYELFAGDSNSSIPYTFLNGARYTFIYYRNPASNSFELFSLADLHEYRVKVIYQFLPYMLITTGEIMVAVSGLVYAYEQAPDSMK